MSSPGDTGITGGSLRGIALTQCPHLPMNTECFLPPSRTGAKGQDLPGLPLRGHRKCQLSAPHTEPPGSLPALQRRGPGSGPSPGSSLTILTAASSDVTVSRAYRDRVRGKQNEEGGGTGGWIPLAPSSPLPRPSSRTTHLVDVAIGPGPHALQQLKAVPRILQRHVPQQRHGPAPGGPADGGELRSGAGAGGAGRGRAGAGGSEAAGAGPGPGAGTGRGCPAARPGGGARGTGPRWAGKTPKPRGAPQTKALQPATGSLRSTGGKPEGGG